MKKLTFLLALFMLICTFSTAEALSPVSIRTQHDAVNVTIASDEESVATLTAGVIIGTIPGIKNTEFTIRAAKVSDILTNQSQTGVLVEVKRTKGRLAYRHASFIDYEHLDKLIKWLNAVNQVKKDPSLPFEYVANLRFQGVITLDVMNTVARTRIRLKSGGSNQHVVHFDDMMVLLQMETYFATAQKKLDAIK